MQVILGDHGCNCPGTSPNPRSVWRKNRVRFRKMWLLWLWLRHEVNSRGSTPNETNQSNELVGFTCLHRWPMWSAHESSRSITTDRNVCFENIQRSGGALQFMLYGFELRKVNVTTKDFSLDISRTQFSNYPSATHRPLQSFLQFLQVVTLFDRLRNLSL